MILHIILLIAGLLLILEGSNLLVDGSSSVAKKSGLSEFVIGLTIVGIGTSTPEMVVSFYSALTGHPDIAVGNIVGSNIFNTALILGLTALIIPLTITKSNIKRDIPMNIGVSLLLIALGFNATLFGAGTNTFSRVDGAILLALFVGYLVLSFKLDTGDADEQGEEIKLYKNGLATLMIVGGIAALVFGGRLFVDSASAIAQALNVPQSFIAITIMALGTSLPELVTCIVAACKGHGQLALGNIIGSNISNILCIVGGSALIHPLAVQDITPVDLSVMLLSIVFIFAVGLFSKKKQLFRVQGVVLLLIEVGYLIYLFHNL